MILGCSLYILMYCQSYAVIRGLQVLLRDQAIQAWLAINGQKRQVEIYPCSANWYVHMIKVLHLIPNFK